LDDIDKARILSSVTPRHDAPPSAQNAGSNADAPTSHSDKRKQSLYFPESMLEEINGEAARLERSLSWVVQRAWKVARAEIRELPGSPSDGE
jgi:uncharacterized small protein (TIGR04563 family)